MPLASVPLPCFPPLLPSDHASHACWLRLAPSQLPGPIKGINASPKLPAPRAPKLCTTAAALARSGDPLSAQHLCPPPLAVASPQPRGAFPAACCPPATLLVPERPSSQPPATESSPTPFTIDDPSPPPPSQNLLKVSTHARPSHLFPRLRSSLPEEPQTQRGPFCFD